MRKNPLFNIVKTDVKISKEYSRKNIAMQTLLFQQRPFYKSIIPVLSVKSIVLMSEHSENEKL
jgi:hypothetical protein